MDSDSLACLVFVSHNLVSNQAIFSLHIDSHARSLGQTHLHLHGRYLFHAH